MASEIVFLIPEIALVLTGVAALVCGMLGRGRWAPVVTVAGCLVATALTLPLLTTTAAIFGGTLRVDALAVWAKLILLPSTALVAVMVIPETRGTDRESTVHALLALTTVGALVLADAGDLMFLVLGVALSSLGSFALVAYRRDDKATEGALKFFVFGAISNAAMIFGLAFWFGATGSTLLAGLDDVGQVPLAAIAGLLGVLLGLGYEASLVPLHFWAPDAYQGAPGALAAYVSVIPKLGAIFALTAVVTAFPGDLIDVSLVLGAVSVASMTYGNLGCLRQSETIRFLAYSSIAQAGYFLLGIAVLGRTPLAIPAVLVFGAAYAAANLGIFAVVLRFGRSLSDYEGLGRTSPMQGMAAVIFLMSLTGLPPLGGFVGKLLLFGAAIDGAAAWLAVAGILNSVLSLAVYLRIMAPLFRTPNEAAPPRPGQFAWNIVTLVTLALTVAIGVAAEPILRAIGAVA
jgi:NADH-quinone oxidoreductase subunit N